MAFPARARPGPWYRGARHRGRRRQRRRHLTITLINRLRAAGEEQPACAWLASPWTDLTMSGASLETKATVDPLIHKAYLEELADCYAPAPTDRKDPLISPLFAELTGFPPVLIQIGSAETLLDIPCALRARRV